MRAARAIARTKAWAAGATPGEVVLVVDASLVEIHSERKQGATPHFKRGLGFHPMFCFLDATGEALAGVLRPGNAAANSGVDQLVVVDLAIAQLPVEHRRGHAAGDDPDTVVRQILVRADSAGAVRGFIDGLVVRNCLFSISARVSNALDAAITAVTDNAWQPAVNSDGEPRRGAQIAELDLTVEGWPPGTRAIVRRERPHPGAQLRLWDHNGMRHQVVLTNQSDAVELELRHRRHGQVENRIKNLKDCGLERVPFTSFTANAAWMEIVRGSGTTGCGSLASLVTMGVERWYGRVESLVPVGGGIVSGFDVGEGHDTWQQRGELGLEPFGGVVSMLNGPVVGDEQVDVHEALAAGFARAQRMEVHALPR